MTITMNDLESLDITAATVAVAIGGRSFSVRPLSIAEEDEVEALLPHPLAPRVKDPKTGDFVRDLTADGYAEKCETVDKDRRALRAAIAAGLTIGGLSWTRESLEGRRPPVGQRTRAEDVARAEYAQKILPEMRRRVDDMTTVKIMNAAYEAVMGKDKDEGGDGSPTP